MGQSQSKIRSGPRPTVDNPDTGATPLKQTDQEVRQADHEQLKPIETTFRPEETEPAQCSEAGRPLDGRPFSSPQIDDHDTATWVAAGSSPTTSHFQRRLSKMGQLSEVPSKPQLRWNPASPATQHPNTSVEVFQKGWVGGKRALRILCSDLCKGLPHLAGEWPGVWAESSHRLVIEPYEPIFHNIARIRRKETAQLGSGNWQEHLLFLVDSLEQDSPEAWARFKAIEDGHCKAITFDTVPLLYPQGATVLQNDNGAWRAYVIERLECKTSASPEVVLIHARYLDFDTAGKSLVPHATVFELPRFDSERPIGTLDLIPSQWFSDPETKIMDDIKKRGLKYREYCGRVQYCEYRGDEWPRPSPRAPLRVIVDYITSSRHNQASESSGLGVLDTSYLVCTGKCNELDRHSRHVQHDALRCSFKRTNCTQHQGAGRVDQDDDASLFCPPGLWAFSLHFKTWRKVSPLDLKEVPKRDEPFDDELFMEFSRKKHFKSIVMEYQDILKQSRSPEGPTQMEGGLNVLLCGNTGVGKTFTAECISEKFGLPLYTMTCGDLGDEPELFDLRLHDTFLRGINWGAIVLLDEVDEYVYSRNRYLVKRSYLTPILLRHLKTSESLTIITMTRTEEPEDAFMGHLQLSLHLPDFSLEDQKKIWIKAINSVPFSLINKIDLHNFINNELHTFGDGYSRSMNARQITNAVRLATAIARGDGRDSSALDLNVQHIKTTLKLGKDFKDYMEQKSKPF